MPHGMLDPWFARELNISKIIKKSIWILYEYMLLKMQNLFVLQVKRN